MLSYVPASLGGSHERSFPTGHPSLCFGCGSTCPLSALSFATGQVFTAPLPAGSGRLTWPIFYFTGTRANQGKRRRNKMTGRTHRGKHASLRAGSSPFLSCTGLPAPCSRRLKVKQAADKKILIKKPPTAKKCETSCAGGRPFFCLFILSALDSMARGELLRSRSLTRPPLANLAGAATG